MAYGFVPFVHIAAVVLSIIELGLTGYVVSRYVGLFYGRSPDTVNFMVFNSVWSLLVLAYVGLTPLYATRLFHKLASLALLVVTMIFWFAGSIALAVFTGVPQCSSANTYCGSAQAAVAFGFFLWAIFLFLCVLDGIEAMRSRGHATGTTHHHNKPHAYPGV